MTLWRPQHDDGDALRLAVKLNLAVVFHPVLNQALCRPYHTRDMDREAREDAETAKQGEVVRAAHLHEPGELITVQKRPRGVVRMHEQHGARAGRDARAEGVEV